MWKFIILFSLFIYFTVLLNSAECNTALIFLLGFFTAKEFFHKVFRLLRKALRFL